MALTGKHEDQRHCTRDGLVLPPLQNPTFTSNSRERLNKSVLLPEVTYDRQNYFFHFSAIVLLFGVYDFAVSSNYPWMVGKCSPQERNPLSLSILKYF